MILQRYLDGRTLDEVAIARIKAHEPEDGFYVAFSGGKDSVVILDLVKRSGCKFDAHYNLTTVDPPELVRFVRTFPEVEVHRPVETMWQLIRRKGMPPRRNRAFCCDFLKERAGAGRVIVTGIRWVESSRRRTRRFYEGCYRNKTKHYLNPILDWEDSDVWDYIREYRVRYCQLYDEGWKRLGCVMCPRTGTEQCAREAARWPKLAAAWKRAIKATFNATKAKATNNAFSTPEEYWQWWLNRDARATDRTPVLFE